MHYSISATINANCTTLHVQWDAILAIGHKQIFVWSKNAIWCVFYIYVNGEKQKQTTTAKQQTIRFHVVYGVVCAVWLRSIPTSHGIFQVWVRAPGNVNKDWSQWWNIEHHIGPISCTHILCTLAISLYIKSYHSPLQQTIQLLIQTRMIGDGLSSVWWWSCFVLLTRSECRERERTAERRDWAFAVIITETHTQIACSVDRNGVFFGYDTCVHGVFGGIG